MADNKNVKTKIWVYAVVLFTSAFIVLLFAAYSQIKLNKNLVDYKNQVSSQKSEKNKVQLSFANAQEINNKLNEENKKLVEEKKSLSETIDKLEKDLSDVNDKSEKQISGYEEFSAAQSEYFRGNIVNSVLLLKKIDISLFDLKTKELYNIYASKVYDEAGKSLYDDGYKLYKQGKYQEAWEKLSLSRNISTKGEYADNCLYYFAKSAYKVGIKESAIEYMNTLIKEYPESPFIKSAKSFVQKYGEIKP